MLIALAVPLLLTAWTADSARWVTTGLPLWAQVVLSLALGYAVALRVAKPLLAHAIGGLVIVGVATAVGLATAAGSPVLGMTIFLVWLTWSLGYATIWIACRTTHAKWAFLPGWLVLLVLLANLPGSMGTRSAIYLGLSGPSLAMLHYRLRHGVARPSGGGLPLAGLVMAGAVAAVAWVGPTFDGPARPALVTQAGQVLHQLVSRSTFFNEVPNRRVFNRLRIGDTLPMSAPLTLSSDLMLLVRSSEPHKWRLETYETYAVDGWSNPPRGPLVASGQLAADPGEPLLARREVQISVQTAALMDHIATPGVPVSTTIGNYERRSEPALFTVNLARDQRAYLPPDIGALRERIVDGKSGGSLAADVRELDLVIERSDDATVVLRRQAVSPAESLALVFDNNLIPPRTYASVGSVSEATFDELRGAGGDYPIWAIDRYLQLPQDFPEKIRILAEEIVKQEANAHDRAVAIQRYLRALPYTTEATGPPAGRDPVEWFLFESRKGFCTYYASAMITMLRSLGIPARLAVGFAPGTIDEQLDAWMVQAQQYHAWPEVYFPDYGWVEFEPTSPAVQSSLALIDRQISELVSLPVFNLDELAPCEEEGEICDEPELEEGPFELPVLPQPQDNARFWTSITVSLASLAGFMFVVGAIGAGFVRWSEPTGRAYLYVRIVARIAGQPRLPRETPMEFSARLSRSLPRLAGAFATVAGSIDVAWYSETKQLTASQRDRLQTASREAGRAIPALAVRKLGAMQLLGRWLPT